MYYDIPYSIAIKEAEQELHFELTKDISSFYNSIIL